MKHLFCFYLLFSTVAAASASAQQPPTKPSTSPASALPPANADDAAIRTASEAFLTAFNQHDAKAVAALWTEEGEYIDEAGQLNKGRKAIENAYAVFFTAHPDARITITIDSLRLLSSNTAIEDGHAEVQSSTSRSGSMSSYTVVHTKVGDRWLMASVRDLAAAAPVAVSSAADLQWLVGTWQGEEHGVKTESKCDWVIDGRFLEHKYTITQLDGTTSTGVQMIGWNPQEGCVQSWSFSPDGGHAIGQWNPVPGGWASQTRGVTGDGRTAFSVNTLRRLDDNAYVWQSVQRTLDGQSLPDTDEVVLKRAAKKQ